MRSSNYVLGSYKFWPVGQGLFSTGQLHLFRNKEPSNPMHTFNWVYDCGTTSAQKYLINSLNTYKQCISGKSAKPKINLVVISHFDKDHISGLVELIKNFSVKTILFPYAPLWQRLLIAFEEGVDTIPDLINFFVNPAEFLISIAGADIGEILFVPANNQDGVDLEDNLTELPDIGENGFVIETENLVELTSDQQLDEALFKREFSANTSVNFFGKRLIVSKMWEFIPYNDINIDKIGGSSELNKFQKTVEKLRDKIISKPSSAVLDELKDLYDEKFGRSSESRNIISMFMYTGPISQSKFDTFIKFTNHSVISNVENLFFHEIRHYSSKIGALFTGDGYVNTPYRFKTLSTYLKSSRIKKIFCLQVMHHGSKANWFEGVAQLFNPSVSVFCSDPLHRKFKHPHGEVVRDFLRFNPIQVDKSNGVEIFFVYDHHVLK
jgi:beta-lactamase superfamily II metal-dependent hydrolase